MAVATPTLVTRLRGLLSGRPSTGTATVTPFTDALGTVAPGSLVAGAREVPVALLASLMVKDCPPLRRVELVEALAQQATDRNALAEYFVLWFTVVDAAVSYLEGCDDIPADRLAPLRWRVVECAARAGLATDLTRAADAAVAADGGVPAAIAATMPEWRAGSRPAAHAMVDLLERVPTEGAEKAKKHFKNLLSSFHNA